MNNLYNKTLRTVTAAVWDAYTQQESTFPIVKGGYVYATAPNEMTHVKFAGGEWISVPKKQDYSIYRDVDDQLRVTEGSEFCKRCLDEEGVPASKFSAMRCERCGTKTDFRKTGEKVALQAGAAAAMALVFAAFKGSDD